MRRLLFLLAAMFMLTISAFAAQDFANINNEEEGFAADASKSMTVSMSLDSRFLDDGFVRIYDVGTYDSGTGLYQLDREFEKYGLDINDAGFANAAWDCFRRDGMACRAYGALNHEMGCKAEFYNLRPVVYLVAGDDFWHDGVKYRPAPVLACLADVSDEFSVNLDCGPVPYDGSNLNEIFSSSISTYGRGLSGADSGTGSDANSNTSGGSVWLDALFVFLVCVTIYMIVFWLTHGWKEAY